MENIAIYNRCSTEEESQINALAVQAEESREIAQQMGWNIAEQYVESQSGTTAAGRSEYLRMLEAVEAGRFDIVMIKSIDRLARNAKDWYLFLDCLVRNNTKLYLYLERKFYASDDALITGIKAILAEQFSKELSDKIKNAHKRRQEKRSGYNITRDMFGWDKVEKDVYKVNEEEAYFFREACGLVEQGYGYRRLSNRLYELGARSKSGGRISETQWRKLLHSPRAHGTVVLRRQEYDFEAKRKKNRPEEEWIYIENALPALITKEYHERILGLLEKRAPLPHTVGRGCRAGKYELSGKLVCAECGASYYRVKSAKGRTAADRTERVMWKCGRYMREGAKRNGGSALGCSNIKLEEGPLRQALAEACSIRYREFYTEGGSPDPEGDVRKEALRIIKTVLQEDAVGKEEKRVEQGLLKLQREQEKLIRKLLEGVVSDEDYRSYHTRIVDETASLTARLDVIKKEHRKYNNHEARLDSIGKLLWQEEFLKEVLTRELVKKIEAVRVYRDSTLQVEFEGGDASGALRVQYRPAGRGGIAHAEQKEAVYNCIKENREIKIFQIMEKLGMKESAVHNRIRELKSEGKIQYKRGQSAGYWELPS